MKTKNIILLFAWAILICLPCILNAQKAEVGALGGVSFFFGDIQGKFEKKGSANDYFLAPKTTAGVYTRTQVNNKMSVRANMIYSQLAASDQGSSDYARKLRNLHFKTDVVEVSVQTEYKILSTKVFKGKYKKEALQNKEAIDNTIAEYLKQPEFYVYTFVGVGIFHFNPKAELNGTWHELQPLGTEGQVDYVVGEGIPKNKAKYDLTEVCIPMGAGMAYSTKSGVKIGMEFGWRKTFTDYIDDVSTVFPNLGALGSSSAVAPLLANRTYEVTTNTNELANFTEGDKRGNSKNKDSFMFLLLTLSVPL